MREVPNARPFLTAVAERLADGREPEWDVATSNASDEERWLIGQLRLASSVARDHALTWRCALSRSVADTPVLEPNTTLGTLRIVEHVGRGHFGHVYRAWDSTLQREVALKVLHDSSADTEEVLNEGRLMARVRHSGVITIHSVHNIDGRAALCMEFIEGSTLEEDLRIRGPRPPAEIAAAGIALCEALSAVHAAGLVHRDVKAQNILRETSGRVVLGDFGTGRGLSPDDAGEMAGTPAYAAPEILRSEPATTGSDIYSLGVVLFHLATGAYPVRGTSLRAIREAHTVGQRATLRSMRPDFPAGLAATIERAIEPDPAGRFTTADEMQQALTGWQAAVRRRRQAPWWIAATVAIGLLATTSVWAWLSRATAVDVDAQSWVLIADFENTTADPLLSSTLWHVIEGELQKSRFVNIVTRDRTSDVLRLMRKPDSSVIGIDVADEVARRDGRIQALVSGHVAQTGKRYEVTIRVARTGDLAGAKSVREYAETQPGLLEAVSRASLTIRDLLGEALQAADWNATQLPPVTTSSFEALQLFAQATNMQAINPASEAEKEALLRRAIQLDPDFASAYMALSGAISMQPGVSQAEGWAMAGRAFALADRTNGVERLFLKAREHDYRSLNRSLPWNERVLAMEQAAAGYEAVLREVSGYRVTHDRLLLMYERLNRRDQARRLIGLMVESQPHSFFLNARAGIEAMRDVNLDAARNYARRADALPKADYVSGYRNDLLAWTALFDATAAWLKHDGRTAATTIDRWSSTIVTTERRLQPVLLIELAGTYFAVGRLAAAERRASTLAPSDGRFFSLPLLLIREDRTAAREYVREILERLRSSKDARVVEIRQAVDAAVLAGDIDAARVFLARERASLEDWMAAWIDGRVALAAGQIDAALAALERANGAAPLRFRIAGDLASAWTEKGNIARAIAAIENVAGEWIPSLGSGFAIGHEWLPIRMQLADLYRQAGRMADAHAVEKQVLQLLAVADDDHPIKRRLLARSR